MTKLVVEVREDGTFRVEIDGRIVGFIEDLTLALGTDESPLVNITLMNPDKCIGEAREQAHARVSEMHQLLAEHPYIEVFDRSDTLPSGMPSIRLEDETWPPSASK